MHLYIPASLFHTLACSLTLARVRPESIAPVELRSLDNPSHSRISSVSVRAKLSLCLYSLVQIKLGFSDVLELYRMSELLAHAMRIVNTELLRDHMHGCIAVRPNLIWMNISRT